MRGKAQPGGIVFKCNVKNLVTHRS